MSCQGKPLPLMFVGRDVDQNHIGTFMKKKYPSLCQALGRADTTAIYCGIADFRTLIGKFANDPNAGRMKVYFASFAGSSAVLDLVPVAYYGTTTLVFLGVDGSQKDIETYYIIHPLGGIVKIDKDVADGMVRYFQDKRGAVLEQIAMNAGWPDLIRDPSDPVPPTPPVFKESKAVWYELEKLIDEPRGWLDEMNCQGVEGVTISLAAYPVKDKFPQGGGGAPIGWQLTLIFLLTREINVGGKLTYYTVDIEDGPGFGARPNPIMAGGGDTANPCPPATGCTSSVGNP